MAVIKIYKKILHIRVLAFTISNILACKIFYLENWGQGREYYFYNDAIRISASIKVIALIFTLSVTVLEILTFQMFDLEKCRSRSCGTYNLFNYFIWWQISMFIKVVISIIALTVSKILSFQLFDLENLGWSISRRVQRSHVSHSTANTWLPIWWR